MKQVMDKLKEIAIKNKKLILFLLGIGFIGFISGTIYITIITETDQTLVKNYIINFISQIENHKLNYLNSYKNAFFSNIIFMITIWILGMSVIGIPINIFLYFSKNFMLGFSISSFILQYKTKGCMLALLYIFPHHIINTIIYTIIILLSINFSKRIINLIKNKKPTSLQNTFKRYTIIFILCIIIIAISNLLEIFVTPFLIEKILFIIK